MKSSLVLKNVLSNLLLQLVTIISGLIIPILIISHYGSSYNGLNSSVNQTISYLNLVEAGIGLASMQALYKPLSQKDWKSINGVLSATRNFYLKSGYFFLILVVILAFTYPFIIKGTIDHFFIIGLVITLGGAGVIEYLFYGKYRVLLLAEHKGYVIFNIQSISVLTSTIVKVILILSGSNLILVQGISVLIYLLRVFFVKIYIKEKYPEINYKANPNVFSLNKKNDVLFHQFAFLILNNTDILLLTIFCNLNKVSVYSIYNIVFSSVGGLIISFASSSITTAFGHLMLENEKEGLLRRYSDYEFAYFLFISWIYTITFLMIIPFVKLYTKNVHDVNYIDYKLPYLFVTIGFLNNVRNPLSALINAAGHFKETKYRALFEAVINLVVSLILVQFYGMYGVLIGTITAFVYRTSETIWYTNFNILNRLPTKTIKRLFTNILIGLFCIFIVKKTLVLQIANWIDWIKWATITSLLTLLIFIFINVLIEPKSIKNLFIRLMSLLLMKFYRF